MSSAKSPSFNTVCTLFFRQPIVSVSTYVSHLIAHSHGVKRQSDMSKQNFNTWADISALANGQRPWRMLTIDRVARRHCVVNRSTAVNQSIDSSKTICVERKTLTL